MTSEAVPQTDANDALYRQVEALFVQYYQPLYTYLYCLVDDRELAHDLVQETFLKLVRTRAQLQEVKNPRAWLYRIATNLTFNRLKRRRRFTWLPWHLAEHLSSEARQDPVETVDRRMAVEKAMAALPPDYRAPLILYSYEGWPIAEIALALNRKESTVKVQLHRARKLFQAAYTAEDGRDDTAGDCHE